MGDLGYRLPGGQTSLEGSDGDIPGGEDLGLSPFATSLDFKMG